MHQSMTWWIRAFLISSAARGLLLGVNGLLDYRAISIPLQFTPLNAAFVAGLYLAGTIGLILTLFTRDRADARPFLIGTAVVTTLLLAVTGLHWSEFETTLSPKLIGWVGSYVFDPVAITLLVTTHGLGSPGSPGRHRLTPLFLAEAGLLGMLGWFLLALPEAAAAVWPWVIPPLLAQLYSCFLIAFAVIALLVAHEQRPVVIRNFTITSLALIGFILLASLLYLERFTAGAATWIWFGGLSLGIGAFGIALVAQLFAPRQNASELAHTHKGYDTVILER
jgi:hypothetical protein